MTTRDLATNPVKLIYCKNKVAKSTLRKILKFCTKREILKIQILL